MNQPTESTELPAECCANCKFGMADGGNFDCRRYPPQMLVMNSESHPIIKQDIKAGGAPQIIGTAMQASGISGRFPTMMANGWCGEWRAAKSTLN